MDQSQITEFVNMINSQVGIQHDQNVRKQNEELLKNFRETKPDLFVQLLLTTMTATYDSPVRTYSASQIRKNLSEYSEKSYTNLWFKMSEETKTIFKNQIFQILDQEPASNIRSLICDAIGEIGACLIDPPENAEGQKMNGNEWPELLNITNQLFTTDRITMIEAGYKIISNLLIYTQTTFDDHREQLQTLFIQGMQNNDLNVKVAAIQAVGSFVTTLEPKSLTKFPQLVPALLETTYQVIIKEEDDGETCLSVIADICEDSANFFKKEFGLLFTTMFNIFKSKEIENIGIKRITMETLLLVVENYPVLIKNNNEYKKNLIEMIFFYMVDMEEEIEDSWKCPPEGFREQFSDDGDNASVNFGMNSIDRLMQYVGQDKIMPVLSEIVQQLLVNQDWRYPFASLMALSQIGEYLDEVSDINNIVPIIFKFVQDPNPKLKYAALHAIGQISDDMQPEFQTTWGGQVLPLLIGAFDDPVPRVQSHALASMTNFMEGASKEIVAPYLKEALQKSFILLEKGISIIKENALSNIASLAEAAASDFNQYYTEVIPIIFQVYNNHTGDNYKQLRGCVVEAITVIGESIDHDKFLPYFNDTVQLILKIQQNELDNVDPQKNFVLTGWSRLCQKYSNEILQFLPQIIPSSLKVIQQIIDQRNNEESQAEAGEGGHTFQHKEAETAMNMLDLFVDKLGSNLGPYIEQLTQILLPLCQFRHDEDIRCQASRCLPGLVKAVVKDNRQLSINLVKEFISLLYSAAAQEYDAQTIHAQVEGMKGCIEEVGQFLSQQELNDLSEKIIALLMDSDKRKEGNVLTIADGDVDEDEKKLFDMDTTHEEELHVAIAELLGVIFKTHPDQCSELSEMIYVKFLPTVLGDNVSQKMHQFGIFLIDDMIEFLQFSRVQARWPHLAEALVKYSCSSDLKVRQATVYGIGVFAQQTPQDQFKQYSQPLLQALSKSLQIQCADNQPQKSYQHCKDNTIAAVGKICQSQWANIDDLGQVLTHWVSLLPLKKDKPEGFIQNEFLCDIILNEQQRQVFFASEQNYLAAVTVLGKVVNTKLSNPEINQKIKQSLAVLSTIDYVKTNWNTLTSQLDAVQLQKLQEASQ